MAYIRNKIIGIFRDKRNKARYRTWLFGGISMAYIKKILAVFIITVSACEIWESVKMVILSWILESELPIELKIPLIVYIGIGMAGIVCGLATLIKKEKVTVIGSVIYIILAILYNTLVTVYFCNSIKESYTISEIIYVGIIPMLLLIEIFIFRKQKKQDMKL